MKPALLLLAVLPAFGWTTPAVVDDPMVHMPGTQQDSGVALEGPDRCANCHGGFDPVAEPVWAWQGSDMAQASRDPLFWATFAVALQDSVWALGTPDAGDVCLRCHFGAGWVEGRSDPPNAQDMTGEDYDGVVCDLCHSMIDPRFADSYAGTRESTDLDETDASSTPSSAEAASVFTLDGTEAAGFALFDGDAFFDSAGQPVQTAWDAPGAGQYFLTTGAELRGPFADASARHTQAYSRFHKTRYFCATCHDVSNPVLANAGYEATSPGDGVTVLPSEADPAWAYGPVERTFSEFLLSDFGADGGADGTGAFAPGTLGTSRTGDTIQTCQDCHMPDVEGYACNKSGTIYRPSGSTEHPDSGVPRHTFAGGNPWVGALLAAADSSSSTYDSTVEALLDQGPATLTLDLSQGTRADPDALLETVDATLTMLESAATIEDLLYDSDSGALSLTVVNHTGHKLPSGYPEGRRVWVNVQAYAGGSLVWEVNPYDDAVSTLVGLDTAYSPDSPAAASTEEHVDELVFEALNGSSSTGELHGFHFILSDTPYKDNRIPPAGFDVASGAARGVVPVVAGVEDASLFSAAEYTAGADEISLSLPAGADAVTVTLYYQATSREYVTFLRAEINGTASSLTTPSPSGETSAYIAQTDAYFSALAAWGETIWDLWEHTRTWDGAAPVAMAATSVSGCADAEVCDGVDNDCDGLVDEDDPGVDPTSALTWYADSDGDGYGDASAGTVACSAPTGFVADASDCDDGDATIHPGAVEYCDGTDNDCDGATDEPDADDATLWYADSDGDGFGDSEASTTACTAPSGYLADGSDCDDGDAGVYPGATERCDGVDEDCDGSVDDAAVDAATWYADGDGDGYGDAASTVVACSAPTGFVADATDCDDGEADVHPGATEYCDGVDDDCDGSVDEAGASGAPTWYGDSDGDGYGDPGVSIVSCVMPSGYAAIADDCDDGDAAVHPGATELCDGTDNDCDGVVDEPDAADALTWYADSDGDGYGDPAASTTACVAPSGYLADGSDCDDGDASVHPGATEHCDGVDEDCDGSLDDAAVDALTWYADSDGDGYGDAASAAVACSAPTGFVADTTDCDDGDADIHPGATELCDGADNDCDGVVDEADAADASTWYADSDGDGYGDAASTAVACSAPTGFVPDAGDCDDGDLNVHPGAAELCDEVDNDCDGVVDEDVTVVAWYADADDDGYGDEADVVEDCAPQPGRVQRGGDCDDGDAAVNPAAVEICNGVDDDCDGLTDDDDDVESAPTWYLDGDEDGFGDPDLTLAACEAPEGWVADGGDCDDTDAAIHPGAEDIPGDGVDQDCDGEDAALDTGAADDTGDTAPADTGDSSEPEDSRPHDSEPGAEDTGDQDLKVAPSGCGCGRTAPAGAWLGLLGLLGLAARRRRAP